MHNKTKRILTLCVLLVMVFVSALSTSCRISIYPAYSVEVQNNSDKLVVIFARAFIDGEWGEARNWGQIDPGERRALFAMVLPASKSEDKRYLVEARNLDGKIVHSWEFQSQERILLVIDSADEP